MATKTISLELDAYEKLRKAKLTPKESFSSVVRRAVFPGQPGTATDLLEQLARWKKEGRVLLSDEELNRLDEVQREPRISESHWDSP